MLTHIFHPSFHSFCARKADAPCSHRLIGGFVKSIGLNVNQMYHQEGAWSSPFCMPSLGTGSCRPLRILPFFSNSSLVGLLR